MHIVYIPITAKVYFNFINLQDTSVTGDIVECVTEFLRKNKIDYDDVEHHTYSMTKQLDLSFRIPVTDTGEVKSICEKIEKKLIEKFNVEINFCQIGG